MKVLLNARGKSSEKYARPLLEVRNQLQGIQEKQLMTESKAKNWISLCCLSQLAKAAEALLPSDALQWAWLQGLPLVGCRWSEPWPLQP